MIDSLSNSKKVEKKNLNKQADKVKNCEEATIIVKEYEHIIRKKKEKHHFCSISARESFQKIQRAKEDFKYCQRIQGK